MYYLHNWRKPTHPTISEKSKTTKTRSMRLQILSHQHNDLSQLSTASISSQNCLSIRSKFNKHNPP